MKYNSFQTPERKLLGAGLGKFSGKIWRNGLMGYNARSESVDYCLDSLKSVLNK